MAPQVPYGHPTSSRAGDTWTWRISFADYPVSESWVLSYALVSTSNVHQAPLTWDVGYVANDGHEYTVTIPASITTGFQAGNYKLTAFVTLNSLRYSPYSAPLLVEADSASLAAGDGLSHAEKTWKAIKDAIEGRIPADVESYQISGRALNRIPSAELRKWEAIYAEMVWRERHPGQSRTREITFW